MLLRIFLLEKTKAPAIKGFFLNESPSTQVQKKNNIQRNENRSIGAMNEHHIVDAFLSQPNGGLLIVYILS